MDDFITFRPTELRNPYLRECRRKRFGNIEFPTRHIQVHWADCYHHDAPSSMTTSCFAYQGEIGGWTRWLHSNEPALRRVFTYMSRINHFPVFRFEQLHCFALHNFLVLKHSSSQISYVLAYLLCSESRRFIDIGSLPGFFSAYGLRTGEGARMSWCPSFSTIFFF